MKNCKRLLRIHLLVLSMGGALTASAEPASNPSGHPTLSAVGVPITLPSLAGFEPAENFVGWIDAERGASIVVAELSGSYKNVAAGFTSAALISRGMTEKGRRDVSVSGYEGLLVRVVQWVRGKTYEKRVLIFGDHAQTVVLTGKSPSSAGEELAQQIEDTLLKARWVRVGSISRSRTRPVAD